MEKHRRKFAWLFLTVFVSNFFLGCAQDNAKPYNSAEVTISNIRERLENKDYRAHDRAVNPMAEYKKVISDAIRFAKKSSHLKVNQSGSPSSAFRMVNAVPVSDEYATWGIDNPQNLDLVLQEAISYYSGTYSAAEVTSAVTSLNNYMLSFPRNESGAEQLLADGVASGSMTSAQRAIIEVELQALANAASSAEAMNILNVINQELANSQINTSETNELYLINAGIEGAIDSGVIAGLGSKNNAIQTAQAVGGGIFLVGVALLVIGMFNDNTGMVVNGFNLALAGMMIVVM